MQIDFDESEMLAMACVLECHYDRIMFEYDDCFSAEDHKEFKGLVLKINKTLEKHGVKKDWRSSEKFIKEIKKLWDVEK